VGNKAFSNVNIFEFTFSQTIKFIPDFDSSGSFPSNMNINSTTHSMGNLDECLLIQEFNFSKDVKIRPKYCIMKLKIKSEENVISGQIAKTIKLTTLLISIP
jgi:hypothetical protein